MIEIDGEEYTIEQVIEFAKLWFWAFRNFGGIMIKPKHLWPEKAAE